MLVFSSAERTNSLAEFTALPEALVQIQNASGLGLELWVSRKI